MRSELKPYTEDVLAEQQRLYNEVFTQVWENEGQYCRAGGGQYEKSFAWWAFKHQQTKVDELQSMFVEQARTASNQQAEIDELQKRVDGVKQLIEDYKDPNITSDKSFQHGLLLVAIELEQALKGGEG